jgi:hypothetical protein
VKEVAVLEMMAEACGGFGWLTAAVATLVLVLLILASAALVKYLFAGRRREAKA